MYRTQTLILLQSETPNILQLLIFLCMLEIAGKTLKSQKTCKAKKKNTLTAANLFVFESM